MTKQITIFLYTCKRCNHKWWPRVLGGEEPYFIGPNSCPKCKSPYWDKERSR